MCTSFMPCYVPSSILVFFIAPQLKAEEASSKDYKLQIQAMKTHALELDGMQKAADMENSELRKEKILLVDHVAELQRKVRIDNLHVF